MVFSENNFELADLPSFHRGRNWPNYTKFCKFQILVCAVNKQACVTFLLPISVGWGTRKVLLCLFTVLVMQCWVRELLLIGG